MKFIKKYILLLLGSAWIALNVYFLPFFAWTTGIVWSWLILHGYVPYRDFIDNRTHFDLFLFAGWSYLFGSNQAAYQSFAYFILLAITAFVFILSRRISSKIQIPTFIFYLIFLFPLFQNTEMDELLIGFFPLLLLATIYKYLDKKNLWILFTAGIISSISFFTKQTSGGIILASVVIIVFDSYIRKRLHSLFKAITFYFFGFLIPTLIFIGYLIYHNAFSDFIFQVFILTNTYLTNPVPPGFSLGEGLMIEIGYVILLIPFVLYWKQTKLSIQKIIFLALLIISLSPTIMPALLSYRAFPGFPLVALVAGFDFVILISKHKNELTKKLTILFSFAVFIILTFNFFGPYISSIKDEGFHFKNFITDYNEEDYRVAQWIKENTQEKEKIMTSTSFVVYLLSNRLPKNKYMIFERVLLLPYDESTRVFTSDPPRIFVLNTEMLETRPDLKTWPFLSYLKSNYRNVATYGTNEIFVLK